MATSSRSIRQIYDGGKLTYLSIGRQSTHKIRFIDSLNWIPVALSKFPSMLGLKTGLRKGFFPHWFNMAENQAYVGVIPDVKIFHPDQLHTDPRREFYEWWHNKRKETTPGTKGLGNWQRS